MQDEWWERPVCFFCDYWWVLLILLALALTGWFTRDSWMPVPPPTPTATATLVPTPSPRPSATPVPPSATPTLEPTLTLTPIGSLGTGDVQVTLLWDSINDLDLWVTDPAGETIYFGYRHSTSNGELDVDANAGCSGVVTNPVENIYWPVDQAPEGTYTVAVQYFAVCQTERRAPFTIRLLVDGRTQTFEGMATTEKENIEITTFTVER